MDTAMQQKIRHEMEEGQVRQEFIKLYKNNLLVSTSDSVRVLLKLIEEDSFVNGAHVDYYDIIVSDKDNRHKVT